MEDKNEYDFMKNHFDYGFLWKIISWKLDAMRSYFLNKGRGSRAKKNAEQIAEALKNIDMLVDDKYKFKNNDSISAVKLPEDIQEKQFNDSLDNFVRILKEHSRSWWD